MLHCYNTPILQYITVLLFVLQSFTASVNYSVTVQQYTAVHATALQTKVIYGITILILQYVIEDTIVLLSYSQQTYHAIVLQSYSVLQCYKTTM